MEVSDTQKNIFSTLEKKNTSFGFFIPVLFRNIPIKIQTPLLNVSSKIKIINEHEMSVKFTNNSVCKESLGFSSFIDSIEEYVQNYLLEKNIVDYIPFLFQKNDYYRFTLPIMSNNNTFKFKCYDQDKNLLDLSNNQIYTYLRKDSTVKLIMKCYGIYYNKENKKYGLLWNIEQIKVLPFERNTNYFDNLSEDFENYSIIGNEKIFNSIKNMSKTLECSDTENSSIEKSCDEEDVEDIEN